MSQFVVDDQLGASEVIAPIRQWTTVSRLQSLRPNELILDDRVPEILRTLRHPTFITIDHGCWSKRLCDPTYCILYFALRDDQQEMLPDLLRRMVQTGSEFKTRSARMGKVIRVGLDTIQYWEVGSNKMAKLEL